MISLQFFASFVKHVTRCYLAVLHFALNFSGIMLLKTRADNKYMNTSLNTYLESSPSILSNPKQLRNQGITVLLKCMFSNHSIIHFFHCTFNQIEFLQMEIFIQPSNLSGKYNTIHASMIPLVGRSKSIQQVFSSFHDVCIW